MEADHAEASHMFVHWILVFSLVLLVYGGVHSLETLSFRHGFVDATAPDSAEFSSIHLTVLFSYVLVAVSIIAVCAALFPVEHLHSRCGKQLEGFMHLIYYSVFIYLASFYFIMLYAIPYFLNPEPDIASFGNIYLAFAGMLATLLSIAYLVWDNHRRGNMVSSYLAEAQGKLPRTAPRRRKGAKLEARQAPPEIAPPADLGVEGRKLYDLIGGAGGAIFQSELVDKSGFSKVKVSRILDRLEGRGLLERRRRGMTNIVLLKKG